MTTPAIRADFSTVAGAQVLNLGQANNITLLIGQQKPVVAPSTLNIVVATKNVVVRPTQ